MLFFILLILLTLPAVLPLFTPGLPSTHDGVSHVARFIYFHRALFDGQIIPRWNEGIAFGLGSPVLGYSAYLPYLSAEIPRFLGASWAFSVQIVFALSFMLSAVTFYLWAKEIFGKMAGFVGAMFYVWAPYRFVDIYVRGEFPESFAFIFPPLLLLFAKRMLEKPEKRWLIFIILSFSGLILSHLLMAMLFAAVYLIYGLVFSILSGNLGRLKYLFLAFFASLFLTAAFWGPAYFEKDQVNLNYLVSTAPYLRNFADIGKIIYSPWGWGPLSSDSPMSPQLGIPQLLVIVLTIALSLLTYFKSNVMGKVLIRILNFFRIRLRSDIDRVHWVCAGVFSVLLIVSIFLITPSSKLLWENIELISFFFYPWRFLALSVFSVAFIAAFLVYALNNNRILVVVLIALLFYSNKNHMQLVGYAPSDDHFYQSYSNTTDMWGEFLPVKADLTTINGCRTKHCAFEKVLVPSNVLVSNKNESSTKLSFSYFSDSEFQATINTLYFPGWRIYLDSTRIENINVNSLGTMDLKLPQGSHQVSARFEDTFIRSTATYVSALAAVVLLIYLCRKKSLI